jgi:pyruvate dehydrogenase E1 component beta subunit
MLLAALDMPDPVFIFEHATLYPLEDEIDEDAGPSDVRRAAVRRIGDDVTIVAYGGSLKKALEASTLLAEEGVEAEVIDLRLLRPIDSGTIIRSVEKTHRAVIVDEAWRSGSISAEISARIMEEAFNSLDWPVARVCGEEIPAPYAKHMEDAALPQPAAIVNAAREMLA